ncbi:DUF6955 family protein [Mycolicibacter icosiumassiliensis]|uniref:DUF6955 family protein n=1 Tax=Mycolicibacter icosiumassiliensis TaxID=1792835 RepID=UPI000829BCD8|nr:hypothetical protein [Mycolicibacter icosiumassiliensis]
MTRSATGVQIKIWINDERLRRLEEVGMADLARDEFAGMKVLVLEATEDQKDMLLARHPAAKYDSSTTSSIELLPKEAKDKLLELSILLNSTGPDVVDRYLA